MVGGSAGATDLAGNGLATSVSWSFTTATGSPPPPGGPITRVGIGTVVNTTATIVVSIPAPSGIGAGDMLVSCLALNGGNVGSSGVPAGWTSIAAVTGISNPHVFGYYRVASASEPASYSWTLTSSVANSGGIARYTGVSASQPLDGVVNASGASATSATLPGLTTSAANDALVGCLAANSSSSSLLITSPSGMVAAWDLVGKRQQFADQPLSTAGATGSRTWTLSGAREWAGWLVALRPS